MSNLKPVPKVAAVGTAGLAVTILIAVAALAGVELSPELAAALVTVASSAAGFFKRDKGRAVTSFEHQQPGEL